MSEEERVKMDKKGNSRHTSVQKANGTDSKKEVANRNQRSGKKRGSFNSGNGNYSCNEGQSRKPTPQKYKNSWDKRPKQRGEFPTRNRSDLEEEELEVEYGSAIQAGSKKGNLNHLLNFTYEHEINPGGNRGGGAYWNRGRQVRYRNTYSRKSKVYYNKEQFLQANCQFVVKEKGNYSVHLMDPDVLVDWHKVEQVRVIGTEAPTCPICLQYPTAAKMTRCGHIYCWACILHYLALGEQTWRKCPICYESVHNDDLKSVVCREVENYKVGDTITLTLMKKEKGSIYAVPANYWQKQPGKCHNVQETEEVTRHVKLLTASPEQVLDIVEVEQQQLLMQIVDADSSEEVFIKGAQDQIKARQLSLLGFSKAKKEVKEVVDSVKRTKSESDIPAVEPTIKQSASAQKIKQYKSAFSDEEEETEVTQEQPADDNTPEECSNDTATLTTDGNTGPEVSVDTAFSEQPETEEFPVGSPEAQAAPVEMIPDIMPVEEAAEHLELPTQHGDKARHKSGDNAFYFYQADDGQHIYLHSLNARCLVKEYGSLEHSPQKITASIVEKESVFVTEELRKRLRYLSHLPLTCGFDVVELALKPPVISKDTVKQFTEDIEKRRRLRQRKAKDEKRMARHIEEQERKKLGLGTGTIVFSQFQRQQSYSDRLSDTKSDRSDTSSPLIDTPIGSPSGLDGARPGTSPAGSEEGSQTSTVSFAQMLKAGAKSTVWPKVKSEVGKSPISPSDGPAGSDESDNEDKVPVPEYHSSFGSALEAAFDSIETKKENPSPKASGSNNPSGGGGGSGKKKKKQLVLFSTSMARGGK